MKSRVLVLGAGFGGMESATLLSETLGEAADVTVIEKNDTFIFGYSKIDVMFGKKTLDAVRLPYRVFGNHLSSLNLFRWRLAASGSLRSATPQHVQASGTNVGSGTRLGICRNLP
jgi:hypothetical protein